MVVFLREGIVSVVVFGLLVKVLMVVIVVAVAVVAVVVFAVVLVINLIMQDGPKVEAEVPEPGVLGLEGDLVVLAPNPSSALDVANVKETHVEGVEEALEVVVELGARDGAGEVVHAGDVGPVVDGRLLGRGSINHAPCTVKIFQTKFEVLQKA